MNIRSEIEDFIRKLEIYAKQKLNYPVEVEALLQVVEQAGLTDEFGDLIFQAKFLVRTNEIMKRIGPGADGFEKLMTEFQLGAQKSIEILKRIVVGAPEEISRKFEETFLMIETESFHQLMKLLNDLSWVKNWQIDGKPLPYEDKYSATFKIHNNVVTQFGAGKPEESLSLSLSRIQRIAVLAFIMFGLFLLIDPPVTIIGWTLSLGIVIFLVYIVSQIYILIRATKT